MKRHNTLIIIISTIFITTNCQLESKKNQDPIPIVLRPYINEMSKTCDFIELPDYIVSTPPNYITKVRL